MSTYMFPEGFEWGVSSASYQIEGAWNEDGKGESIWDRFSHLPGNIKDGSNGDVVCDFYHHYEEDIKLLKKLGIPYFRLSISWARIFPDGFGTINRKGLEFYRNVLKCLRANGIKAFINLYHWDLPQKLEDRGGWANPEIVGWYENYANTLFAEFGDLVDRWITMNEPFLVAFMFCNNDVSKALAAVHNLLLAHGSAVRDYRKYGLKAEIGITLNLNMAYPSRPDSSEDVLATQMHMLLINHLLCDPIFKGSYPKALFDTLASYGITLPAIKSGDMDLIHQPIDFLGVNNYYAEYIKADPLSPLGHKAVPSGKPKTMMNWEVVPNGLHDLLKWIDSSYNSPKILITENGAACNDWVDLEGQIHDYNRNDYITRHLIEVHRAICDGIHVVGYYVWSFLDDFEWQWGLEKRFGLVYVDYKSQKRIPKESAYWYKKVIENNGF